MSAVEVLEGLKRRVTIKLNENEVQEEKQKRLKDLSKRVRVDGFRPGKVPVKVVDRMHGDQVEYEVINDKVNSAFRESIKDTDIKPAGYPNVHPAPEGAQYEFHADFEVMPEFTIQGLEALTATKLVASVSASDVDDMLDTLKKQRTEWTPKEGEAQLNDRIMVDFIGRMDGEEFEGGKGTDVPLVLGSKSMIPGFEDALVGVKSGDKRTIQVTFPEDYHSEKLKGKAAEFDVTVHQLDSAKLPEIDETFAKEFGIADGDVTKLREELEKNMVRELNNTIQNSLKTELMASLAEANPIDVPEALVMGEVQSMASQSNFPQPKDEEQAQQLLKIAHQAFGEEATKRARLGLILSQLLKEEKIELDQKFVDNRLELLASTYEDPTEVIAHFSKDKETMQSLRNLALEDQIVAFLSTKANITEKAESFKNIMSPKSQA